MDIKSFIYIYNKKVEFSNVEGNGVLLIANAWPGSSTDPIDFHCSEPTIHQDSYLLLVVHRNLDEDHGVRWGAGLDIVPNGLPAVPLLRLVPRHPHNGDNYAHVNPLEEQHHGHYQARPDQHPERRHYHRASCVIPHQLHRRHPAVHLLEKKEQTVGKRKRIEQLEYTRKARPSRAIYTLHARQERERECVGWERSVLLGFSKRGKEC